MNNRNRGQKGLQKALKTSTVILPKLRDLGRQWNKNAVEKLVDCIRVATSAVVNEAAGAEKTGLGQEQSGKGVGYIGCTGR